MNRECVASRMYFYNGNGELEHCEYGSSVRDKLFASAITIGVGLAVLCVFSFA